jgi:hypothetical protein
MNGISGRRELIAIPLPIANFQLPFTYMKSCQKKVLVFFLLAYSWQYTKVLLANLLLHLVRSTKRSISKMMGRLRRLRPTMSDQGCQVWSPLFLLLLMLLPPSNSVRIDVYQAEDAPVMEDVTVEIGPNTGFSTLVYADYGGSGSFVQWDVTTIQSGIYDVTVRYASPTQRPLELWIDNERDDTGYSIVATGSWDAWNEESVTVHLSAGQHKIKLLANATEGPNIDWMSVTGPSIRRSTVLEPDRLLMKGDYRFSPGGRFKAGLDDSGILTIQEDASSTVIWASGTTGGETCYMQKDGNLGKLASNV